MNKHTKETLSRQHAEQLPDRKAMSTIDPTSADAHTSAVTAGDGVHASAGDSASLTDTSHPAASLSASMRADDVAQGTGTHGSAASLSASLQPNDVAPGSDTTGSASSLSASLRVDDITSSASNSR